MFVLFASISLFAVDQKKVEVGVEEKLGSYIPLNTELIDENGNKFLLKDNFDKPVVMNFVYYECPGICSPLLTELASVVGKSDLVPELIIRVLTISMDATEDYNLASSKKTKLPKNDEKED